MSFLYSDSINLVPDKKMKDWKVTGVPSLVVNGKYKVAASRSVRTDELFDVVDFLIEKERN